MLVLERMLVASTPLLTRHEQILSNKVSKNVKDTLASQHLQMLGFRNFMLVLFFCLKTNQQGPLFHAVLFRRLYFLLGLPSAVLLEVASSFRRSEVLAS